MTKQKVGFISTENDRLDRIEKAIALLAATMVNHKHDTDGVPHVSIEAVHKMAELGLINE